MRTFCAVCHIDNIKDWAAHYATEKHQAWVLSVERSRNTYQGEPDKGQGDTGKELTINEREPYCFFCGERLTDSTTAEVVVDKVHHLACHECAAERMDLLA